MKRLIGTLLLAVSTNLSANDGTEGGNTQNKTHYKVGYSENTPRFGGPTSPQGQIEESDRVKEPAFRFPAIDTAFQSWTDTKKQLNDEHGLQLSGHYSVMHSEIDPRGNQADTEFDRATSGIFRANMIWSLTGRGTENKGSLVVTVDHRHGFNDDITPADLAGSAGYYGIANTYYNDIGFAILNFNWQQEFNDGDTGLLVGRYDPNEYHVIQGSTNPWTLFTNIVFNLDASVVLPDSSWGVGAGHWFNDQVYTLGGVIDANGFATDDMKWFEGGSELYSWWHMGWSPSKNDRYYRNFHITTWHVDKRDARPEDDFTGADSSDGFTLSANWMFNETWMPFARYGISNGATPIYNKSATVGLLRQLHYRSDVQGIAINWGDPPDDNLREQTSAEMFWQFQFSQNLEITPSLHYIDGPAFNTDVSGIWQFSTRAHLTF